MEPHLQAQCSVLCRFLYFRQQAINALVGLHLHLLSHAQPLARLQQCLQGSPGQGQLTSSVLEKVGVGRLRPWGPVVLLTGADVARVAIK